MIPLHHAHPWDVPPAEAREIQARLAALVETTDRLGSIERVAGVDVGFDKKRGLTRAAVAVLDFPSLEPREQAVVLEPTRFPYVPGLLSFREAPAILSALGELLESRFTLEDRLIAGLHNRHRRLVENQAPG